jgi:hypothetical protein
MQDAIDRGRYSYEQGRDRRYDERYTPRDDRDYDPRDDYEPDYEPR